MTPPHLDPEAWRDQAGCLGLTWMADEGREAEARKVCGECPVLTECRTWGLSPDGRQVPGVIGGLSWEQRADDSCSDCGTPVFGAELRRGRCWRCARNKRIA